jgi:hypothetical protein|tara:strand:- start:252 stop:1379 length:1128 start_codon:yes stop_codon:yes gene_type:complete
MYTISIEANKKVQADLDIILKIIKCKINPISVILFGGFGKGEGSFEILNGEVRPLNDYDLYVIVRKRLSEDYLESISMECSKAIGRGGEEFCEKPHENYDADRFFHVDLRQVSLKNLSRMKPMQRTFELKRSMVIYGEDLRARFPDVSVPVSDAIRLLFNKLHHLLLGRDNDVRIKTIYIYKAYLDICAALLIHEKNFAATYRDRNQIYQNLDYPKELKESVAWATDFRMQPSFSLDDLDNKWIKARNWVLWALKRIVREELGLEKEDWPSIADRMYRTLPCTYFAPYMSVNFFPAQYLLNYYYVRRAWTFRHKLIKPLIRWRDSGIILGISMMLYHVGELHLSQFYLNKIETINANLKESLLELYGIYYSQRII